MIRKPPTDEDLSLYRGIILIEFAPFFVKGAWRDHRARVFEGSEYPAVVSFNHKPLAVARPLKWGLQEKERPIVREQEAIIIGVRGSNQVRNGPGRMAIGCARGEDGGNGDERMRAGPHHLPPLRLYRIGYAHASQVATFSLADHQGAPEFSIEENPHLRPVNQPLKRLSKDARPDAAPHQRELAAPLRFRTSLFESVKRPVKQSRRATSWLAFSPA